MKELSIKEKAKRYDEAIEIARQIHDADRVSEIELTTCEEIFPELKESDERIRQEIIYHIQNCDDTIDEETGKRMLAWLEKQGEQRPAWSEDDSVMIDNILGTYKTLEDMLDLTTSQDKDILESMNFERDWIKSLKYRIQPKQEWSEEDESILQGIWDEILANKHDAKECEWKTYDKFLNWLKSLRPQNMWKPSEEQMKALNTLNVTGCIKDIGQGALLVELYQDLKKIL